MIPFQNRPGIAYIIRMDIAVERYKLGWIVFRENMDERCYWNSQGNQG